jgi:glycerol-3-phosphate dehydrogenase (NAD(P)+)
MTDKANIYMNNPLNVCVLGGGSFGTALASIASANGYPTRIWMRNEQRVAEINEQHVNSQYLPGVNLHPALVATSSLAVALQDADVIFVSVPSKSFLEVMTEAKIHSRPDQCWVSTTKGIEESGFALMSDILRREVPDSAIGVLSGPNLAKEVAKKALAATVIASREAGLREKVQQVLGCSHFRVYANTDMYGVELGGALKNIYAIISGMAASLELGEKHSGDADHQKPGRNESICRQPWRQPHDFHRSGRCRGSDCHLFIAFEPELPRGVRLGAG